MHSIESYLRRQSTEQLQLILQMSMDESCSYSLDTVLLVYKILAERQPFSDDAQEHFLEWIESYNI